MTGQPNGNDPGIKSTRRSHGAKLDASVTLKLPAKVLAKVDAAAEEDGMLRLEWLRALIRKSLDARRKAKARARGGTK